VQDIIRLGDKRLGLGQPCYTIAEIGVNHEGDFGVCQEMVHAAAEAGADAIKLQTINADENYVVGTESHTLFKKSELNRQQTSDIFELARKLGVHPMTTAGDFETIDWVDELNPVAHKVSSGLLSSTPVIEYLAKKEKPILMSTGMARVEDIELALQICEEQGAEEVALFQCTSQYPAPLETLNLKTIRSWQDKYQIPVGFSDHSEGIQAAITSVAVGADLIEKHFTLDKKRESFDHILSLEPDEFKHMVQGIREVEKTLGSPLKNLRETISSQRQKFQRCLIARCDVKAGEVLSSQHIGIKRPLPESRGLDPKFYHQALGKRVLVDIKKDDPLTSEKIEGIDESLGYCRPS